MQIRQNGLHSRVFLCLSQIGTQTNKPLKHILSADKTEPGAKCALRNSIKAGLPARALEALCLQFIALPSQFPNDRLSPPGNKSYAHTATVNRMGFAPISLFTDHALCSMTDTLYEYSVLLLYFNILFLLMQYIKQTKFH